MSMGDLVNGMAKELFNNVSTEHTERIETSLLSYKLKLSTSDEDMLNDTSDKSIYLRNHLLNLSDTPMGMSYIDLR